METIVSRCGQAVPQKLRAFAGQVYYAGRSLSQMAKQAGIKSCLAGRFNESRVLILTSSPRSGSTWLGSVFGAIPHACILFEPLQLNFVPEAQAAGFSWRTFVPVNTRWPEGEAFLRRVFEGRVVNKWTCREMSFWDAFRAKFMIIKFVRANRLLPWMCETFTIPSPVLLIRHPCAVIASQMNAPGWWDNVTRPDPPPYIANYPKFMSALARTQGIEEYLAAMWALDQLPALMQKGPHPWKVVTYEELFLNPSATLAKIFNAWKVDVDLDEALSRLKKPSSMVYKSGISGLQGWKKKLTDSQVSRILRTVEGFGLRFYSRDAEPDYDLLYSDRMASQIREAGSG